MTLAKTDADGGTLYLADDPLRNSSGHKQATKPATKVGKRPSLDALAERFRAQLNLERRDELAESLGVTGASLDALGVGWATADDLRILKASGAGWPQPLAFDGSWKPGDFEQVN